MDKEGQFDEPEWLKDGASRRDDKGPLFAMRERFSHLDLSGRVCKGSILSKQGGYSDVFCGIYESADGIRHSVVVKQLRVHIVEERKFQRSLAMELYIWSKLKHQNILPLYGFYIEDDRYPNLVAPCMTNGTVMSYLETNPTADVLSLMKGIAEGIWHLHARGIIHSDIKPGNVLISDSNEPRICDFGMSRILEASVSFQASTTITARGTLRYLAKELILAEEGESYSKQADVWAFGMAGYTVMTKRLPYDHILRDASVMLEIYTGKLPLWHEDSESWPAASRGLKLICESCWLEKSERPSMKVVVSRLDTLVKESHVGMCLECLNALRSWLRFNICNIESSYMKNGEIPRLEDCTRDGSFNVIKSANSDWFGHVLDTDNVDAHHRTVKDFFSSVSALHWVEFLSLAGELEMGKSMLQRFIDSVKRENEIVHLAMEWHAFISDFYDAISVSAPHVYISALSWGMPNSVRRFHEQRLLAFEDCAISKPSAENPEVTNELHRIVWHALCLSFSPDRAKFASGHQGGILRIWDAVTGKLIRDIKAHDDDILDVKVSPDGQRIVTASEDKTLRLWDVRSGDLVTGSLLGHTDRVTAVAYSPDGSRIVSGSNDKTLRVWDAQSGAAIGHPLIGHQGTICAVSYSPDGGTIVSASGDKTLRIWDVCTGKQIGEPLRGYKYGVNCASYSPDSRRIVSGSNDWTVRIWDAHTGRLVGEPLEGHQDSVRSVGYSPPHGSMIVSGSWDRTLRIWDAHTGTTLGVIPRGEIRWESGRGCFLSIPSWWPQNVHMPLTTDSLIHSDAPTQMPDDGWLRTLDGELFLWVPPRYREDICCRGPMGKIPPRLKFDWRRVPHGKDWTKVREMLEEKKDQ